MSDGLMSIVDNSVSDRFLFRTSAILKLSDFYGLIPKLEQQKIKHKDS
jgi:hypothetical protein